MRSDRRYHAAVTQSAAAWRTHAGDVLRQTGHRSAAAREQVLDALAERDCCATAQDLADDVQRSGSRVGTASVYRALELLVRLGLVRRLEMGHGTARYEAAHPDGEHHHHLVCDRCGKVTQFEDPALEAAIDQVAARLDYQVGAHDVVLRGACPDCASA